MKKFLLTSIIGTVVLLTGCNAQKAPANGNVNAGSHMMPNRQMMMNDSTQGMGHDSSMTMDDMLNMLKGKTGDVLDEAFLEGMIPHHQGAIDMANEVLANAKHEEIKQMARDIISAQQREIDMMKQWQKDWGYTQ